MIETAFGLLQLLSQFGQVRLSDLTRESRLPRTTVYRLLGQLTSVGVVERVGKHYRLGPTLLTLARHVSPVPPLRTVAQRPLIELATTTRAHVALISMSSGVPIYLDLLPGLARLPMRAEPGGVVTTNSAAERVLLSRQKVAIDDGAAIAGVSCAAHLLLLPGGEAAAVGLVVAATRFPRALLAPLNLAVGRIVGQLPATPHCGLP